MAVGARRGDERADFRRDPRKKTILRGRYMLSDGCEYACRTADISAGGVAIVSAVKGKMGERIVLYLERIGRVEGTVVRHFNGGFAIAFRTTAFKHDTLSETVQKLS